MEIFLALSLPGGWEWVIAGLVALLIFGKRLPALARSAGKSIVEFKHGVNDVQHELSSTSTDGQIDRSQKTVIKDQSGEEHS